MLQYFKNFVLLVGVKIDTTEAEAAASSSATAGKLVGGAIMINYTYANAITSGY